MNYRKKAQLSFVLLVALIVFVLVAITVYTLKPKIGPVDYSDPSSTKVFVERCIEDTAKFALFKLGIQGGYIQLPEEHATVAHLDIAYAFNNANTVVSQQTMAQQLAQFIDAHLTECIDNSIAIFEQRFGRISFTLPQTEVKLLVDDVRFIVDFPLTIEAQDGTIRYDKPYDVRIPVRLAKIHQLIQDTVQQYISTGHLLKLECTLDKGFHIMGESFGADNLFIIEDSLSRLPNSPDRKEQYRFFFVIKDR